MGLTFSDILARDVVERFHKSHCFGKYTFTMIGKSKDKGWYRNSSSKQTPFEKGVETFSFYINTTNNNINVIS